MATEEEVLFDDVYDLCEEIGRWVSLSTVYFILFTFLQIKQINIYIIVTA